MTAREIWKHQTEISTWYYWLMWSAVVLAAVTGVISLFSFDLGEHLSDLGYSVPDDTTCAPVDRHIAVCKRQLSDDTEALWAAEQTLLPHLVAGDVLYTVHGPTHDQAEPLLKDLMR